MSFSAPCFFYKCLNSQHFRGFGRVVVCLFIFNSNVWAQVKLSARLDSTQIEVGSTQRLRVTIQAPEGTKIKPPAAFPSDSTLQALDSVQTQQLHRNGDLIYSQVWAFTAFNSGSVLVERLPYVYEMSNGQRDTLFSPPLSFEVVLMSVDTTKLRPIAPILDEPIWWSDLLPFGLAILGLLILLYIYIWYQKRKRTSDFQAESVVEPPIVPSEWARAQLQAVERADYVAQGKQKVYYSELTRILREYLERRYQIAFADKPTDEVIEMIYQQTDTSARLRPALADLLRKADLVKFAKAETTAVENDRHLRVLYDLINENYEQAQDF